MTDAKFNRLIEVKMLRLIDFVFLNQYQLIVNTTLTITPFQYLENALL